MEIDANQNLGPVSNPSSVKRSAPAANSATDTDSYDSSNALVDSLKNTPDIRPDAVARGRAAVANDGYPPPDVVKKLSNFLAKKLQSNDE